jgi:hypothetical protein
MDCPSKKHAFLMDRHQAGTMISSRKFSIVKTTFGLATSGLSSVLRGLRFVPPREAAAYRVEISRKSTVSKIRLELSTSDILFTISRPLIIKVIFTR